MPNRKQNCQTINQLATQFNLESLLISLTRQLSVDPAAARDRVCLCFAQVLASLVAQISLKENAVGC